MFWNSLCYTHTSHFIDGFAVYRAFTCTLLHLSVMLGNKQPYYLHSFHVENDPQTFTDLPNIIKLNKPRLELRCVTSYTSPLATALFAQKKKKQ